MVAEAEEAVDRELGATEDELRAALEEIVSLTMLPGPRPGDITVMDYVRHVRERGDTVSENGARSRLDRAVERGLLESEFVTHEGRRKKVYRVAKRGGQAAEAGGG